MSAYNHVTLVGNLVKDPETKKVGKKTKTDFIIAVDRYNKENPGIDYFNIVTWGKLADVCFEYLEKGKKVLVDGRLGIRQATKNWKSVWLTEITCDNIKFLTNKGVK